VCRTLTPGGGVVHVLLRDLHGDLTHACSDHSLLVHSWTRDLTFQDNRLRVHDACSVGSGVTATFQLHVPVLPVVGAGGSITAGKLAISIDPTYTVHVVDVRPLNGGDFDTGWRLDITNPARCAYDIDLTANP
jgi:hypothetical protein